MIFKFYAEQIYRYGIDSENYYVLILNLPMLDRINRFLSNQFSLTYADDQDDDLGLGKPFREHNFFAKQPF